MEVELMIIRDLSDVKGRYIAMTMDESEGFRRYPFWIIYDTEDDRIYAYGFADRCILNCKEYIASDRYNTINTLGYGRFSTSYVYKDPRFLVYALEQAGYSNVNVDRLKELAKRCYIESYL